jgi:peptidase C25-like protein
MKHHQKQYVLFVFFLLISTVFMIIPLTHADEPENAEIIKKINETILFSPLTLQQKTDYCSIVLPETNSWMLEPGSLKLPTCTKIYEFAVGTDLEEILITYNDEQVIDIQKPIESVPVFQEMNNQRIFESSRKHVCSDELSNIFPSMYAQYDTGIGLNKENTRVLFLKIILYPVHYKSIEKQLMQVSSFDIDISYSSPTPAYSGLQSNVTYDIVVITPQTYQSTMSPFVLHKQKYGLEVYVETLDVIYDTYQGRDNAEKIKYFVKHAVEEWNTRYVLLIGDVKQFPMRATDAYPWDTYHGNGILTDLYYADLYDSNMDFSSWDANQNDVFGEAEFSGFPPQSDDNIDNVDLYADVHIGRIPCTTNDELITVINKIITYETVTYDQIWFKHIILAGGDTFGLSKGSPPFVYEGEITNIKVGQQLPGFTQTRLWASTRNLHAGSYNRAISKGAGFVSYAGHGFEHGWGTYRPNAIIDSNLIIYYTPFLNQLSNEHRLPIIFFDACLTAKLDFNITDLIGYYGIAATIVNMFLGYTADDFFAPFAWAFLKLEGGGCVANIGATRPAYTYVDKDGVYAGAGYLDVHFFKAYEEGITVGEMLTHAQLDYLNYVGKDFFTVEEYMLLGDPSLMVGGYP